MKHILDIFLKWIISTIFTILVACVCWQVISRYVLASPSTVTDELARFLFMWLALIGGAYTMGQQRHLAIDLLPGLLRGRARMLLQSFILAAIAGFAMMVMITGGSQLVLKTFKSGQVTPGLQIPMGYVYGAIPFAGLIIFFYCIWFLSRLWQDKPHQDDIHTQTPLGGPLD